MLSHDIFITWIPPISKNFSRFSISNSIILRVLLLSFNNLINFFILSLFLIYSSYEKLSKELDLESKHLNFHFYFKLKI